MRRLLSALLLIWALPSALLGAEVRPPEVERFLATRKVLVSIRFQPQTAELGTEALAVIDQAAAELKGLDPGRFIVRIEGFSASRTKGGDVSVSMARARNVAMDLADRHALGPRVSLVGMGRPGDGHPDRVDIAIYDNLWDDSDVQEENILTILFD